MKDILVLKGTEIADPSLYTWDPVNKIFSSDIDEIIITTNIDGVTLNVNGKLCYIFIGNNCTVNSNGIAQTIEGGLNCTFNMKKSFGSRFDTSSNCKFETGHDCIFLTGSFCSFITEDSCKFFTGKNCEFKTEDDCTFHTYQHCTFDVGFGCIIVREDIPKGRHKIIQPKAHKKIKLNDFGEKGFLNHKELLVENIIS